MAKKSVQKTRKVATKLPLEKNSCFFSSYSETPKAVNNRFMALFCSITKTKLF